MSNIYNQNYVFCFLSGLYDAYAFVFWLHYSDDDTKMIFHARTYLFTSLDLKCSILRPECDLVLEPNGFLCSTVVWFQCVLWSVGVEETTARNANLNLPYKYFSEANTNPYVHRKPRIFSMNMVCPDIMDLMYVWKSWHFSLMIKFKDVTRYPVKISIIYECEG